MPKGKTRRYRAGGLVARGARTPVVVAAALLAAASPASTLASDQRPASGGLSPRLAKLAKPSVRSAPRAEQARKLSLASTGPGSLLRDGNRVLVEVRFDQGAAASVDELRSAGAKIVNVSPRYQVVTVAAKPSELPQLSDVPRVAGAIEVLTPVAAATCPSGEIVSEGDQQLRAAEARLALPEPDGSGVEVGILSDSFDQDEFAPANEEEDVKTADLPGTANECGHTTPVDLLDDSEAKGEDEGRAMGQIVHDLAPGASLSFASAFTGLIAFAENIEDLRDAGANVIVDDVSYPNEPFFQEGPVSVAVSDVVGSGVSYFSSAANNNLFDAEGNEIGSWETEAYRDSGGCPPAVKALSGFEGTHCLDFNPGTQTDKTLGIKVKPGVTLSVDLQWAEPWGGVETDLDAFLLDDEGRLVSTVATDNIEGSQRPVEFLQWENKSGSQRTVQLVVNRFTGNAPQVKVAFLQNGFGVTGIEYPRSTETDVVGPTIFGHNGAADAISVAAVPFDESSQIESYSSRGPVTRYFGPVLGSEAAEPLTEPEILAKPDIAATDCGVNTFFGTPVFDETGLDWRFCGTSASAPHAAAVAALMTEAKAATPAEIRSAIFAGAVPVGELGPCAAGAGMIDAVEAVQALLASEAGVAPDCSPPAPEVGPDEARASGDWGAEAPPPPPVAPGGNTPAPQPPLPPEEQGDREAPSTSIKKRPAKAIRTGRASAQAVFVFGSDEQGVTFQCRVDRGRFRPCPTRLVRRFAVGPHVLRVKARDAAGNTDPTPAVYRFQVKRIASG
ncbi:MAG: S8 family serine peptidase [Solirubrobacterales bacterium]